MWKWLLKRLYLHYVYISMNRTIKEVEDYFIDKICNKIYSKKELEDINVSCNNDIIVFLTKFACDLKDLYLSREQLQARMVAPEITQEDILRMRRQK